VGEAGRLFVQNFDSDCSRLSEAYHERADVIRGNENGETEYDDARVIFDIPARTITLQATQKLEGSTWEQREQEGLRQLLEQQKQGRQPKANGGAKGGWFSLINSPASPLN